MKCPTCGDEMGESGPWARYDRDWEYDYCSLKCWEGSEKYKSIQARIGSFLSLLSSSESQELEAILDEPEGWRELLGGLENRGVEP